MCGKVWTRYHYLLAEVVVVVAGRGESRTFGSAGCSKFDGTAVVVGIVISAVGRCILRMVAFGIRCIDLVAGLQMDVAGSSSLWRFARVGV